MKTFKKYLTIFKISAKASVFFQRRIIAQGILQAFRMGILAATYIFVYQSVKVNSNVTVQMAVWSIAAYFTLLSIRFKNLFDDINNDIKLGNIEVLLNRPVNYLYYRIVNQIGSDIFSLIIPILFCFTLLPLFLGFPQVQITPEYIVSALAVSLMGLAIGALMYAVIGFSAFWIEDGMVVYWILDKFVLLLGGAYLPIVFLPDWMQSLVYNTPFGASMFVSHIFYPDFMTRLPAMLVTQVIWIIILGLFNYWVFNKARSRLVVNGG